MRKRIRRANLSTFVPAAAFIIAAIVATAVIGIQMLVSLDRQIEQTEALGERIVVAIGPELADGETAAAETMLTQLTLGKAQIELQDGTRLGAALDPFARQQISSLAIEHGGTSLGTLHIAPLIPYRPAPDLRFGFLLVFVVSVIAAFVTHIGARYVSHGIRTVTEIVDSFSLTASAKQRAPELMFREFRKLTVATIRKTRQVASEVKHLKRTAQIDSRTGLLNEGHLNARIEAVLQRASFEEPAALIALEFGGYADKVDRISSERMLHQISNTLRRAIHSCEESRGFAHGHWPIAALPSDRFAVLTQEFGARDDISAIIREIQAAFRSPLVVEDLPVSLTVQGSIVVIPEDGDSVAQIRQRASDTLLDLRRQNKFGFAFYSPKLERQRDALIKLEAELRTAVQEDRFIPLFQPKIDLQNGRIIGVEALARWQLPNGRLVSPSVFIELAEETGLIGAIGEQILRKSCVEAAHWNRNGHAISLAVNVSPKQFESDDLTQTVLDAIAKSGLPPRRLQIEITESLAISHPDRVKSVIEPLRRLGMQLAIDDFGTGHSNLATLTRLDFDVFKIDRQFVSGLPEDRQANAVVEMILSMAQTLEMQIVGEGIETPEQAEFLAHRGCHVGQGFMYSPPISAEAFFDMLAEQPFIRKRLRA
ncbi:MAG: GGDEF domain-containing phosphodiesterase [Pseudomonadota bacterium]